MLEYFLFYFAYALTLDDDDVNGRGMRRVRQRAGLPSTYSCVRCDGKGYALANIAHCTAHFDRLIQNWPLGSTVPLQAQCQPAQLDQRIGQQGVHQKCPSHEFSSTGHFSTCSISISTTLFRRQIGPKMLLRRLMQFSGNI